MKINIKHSPIAPVEADLTGFSDFIVLLPEKPKSSHWQILAYQKLLRLRLKTLDKTKLKEPFSTQLPNDSGTRLSMVSCAGSDSRFKLLSTMGKLLGEHFHNGDKKFGIQVLSDDQNTLKPAVEALFAALFARQAEMPNYKRSHHPVKRLKEVHLFSPFAVDHRRVHAEAQGNNLARYLTTLPANELRPKSYISRIRQLARKNAWKMNVLTMAQLEKQKAGAFLAVAQENRGDPGGIVHLSYHPAGKATKKQIALVGKGICFDTGGMNLKPAAYMHGMHEDMAGSAVALGCLLTLTQLKVKYSVHCWLAITENHIGANAYRQNDVVTALNGTTIEIIHTDAEGRMVLADTLTLAAKSKPNLIIDYATLTGSCVSALGTLYSGVFGNQQQLLDKAVAAGKASGERVWAFPHDEDYDDDIKSSIADIKQCQLSGGPDHIHGARFLDRFVPENTPWVHVDLSASNHKGGLAHIPTDVTGFGVHLTTSLLLDQDVI